MRIASGICSHLSWAADCLREIDGHTVRLSRQKEQVVLDQSISKGLPAPQQSVGKCPLVTSSQSYQCLCAEITYKSHCSFGLRANEIEGSSKQLFLSHLLFFGFTVLNSWCSQIIIRARSTLHRSMERTALKPCPPQLFILDPA